jgi:tetratricopeptide (TPR) repeat protein
MTQSQGGDPERAIAEFTGAIRADPNFSNAYLQRGNMRFKNGNPDLAIDDFRSALRLDPRNVSAFKARGMALLYKGEEAAALDDLSSAIQIAETDAAKVPVLDVFFARRSRAALYGRRQMSDRELFDLSAMIDVYWKNPDLADALKTNYGVQGSAALMATIYRQRAELYTQRANNDGAIADLSMAAQLDPARALAVILERARVQEAAGRRQQAAADYQRALDLNPRLDAAKQAIARLKAQP